VEGRKGTTGAVQRHNRWPRFRAYLKDRESANRATVWRRTTRCFVNYRGGRLTVRSNRSAGAPLCNCERADRAVSPHALRHSFADPSVATRRRPAGHPGTSRPRTAQHDPTVTRHVDAAQFAGRLIEKAHPRARSLKRPAATGGFCRQRRGLFVSPRKFDAERLDLVIHHPRAESTAVSAASLLNPVRQS